MSADEPQLRRQRWLSFSYHPTWDAPEVEVPHPDEARLIAALDALDGDRQSEFSIHLHDPVGAPVHPLDDDRVESLLVGGGEGDRVAVAHVVRDDQGGWDQEFAFLTEQSRGDGAERRTFGGQETRLPARAWVTRALAARAVRHFYATHMLDPELRWQTERQMTDAIE